MGTRSTTTFYENETQLATLYKQYDGQTDAWGLLLKNYIGSKKWTNGYIFEERKIVFNGIGCFIAQLIAKFKDCAGDLSITTLNDEQEFNYSLTYQTTKHPTQTKEGKNIIKDGYIITLECKEDSDFKKVWKEMLE